MSHLSSVPERNRDRRPRERLAGSTGWERAGDRTVTVKHFCLMEELALEISTATNEDGLFEALARASMRLGFDHFRSEEHTSELQSLMRISYAVFCLKKKKKQQT